ncbi:hypothetical protein [Mycoplasma struthionis]|uniref:Uncharacterized protein n=1 Tax=Mycoplasma struthionis TaxID=538220 RepID=A0A502M2D8_9MOLU|nr:hypothetical protein [Mycoplasma struthionis]TPI02956.1 hypothetical protein FJM01_00185 [Mycoplasma struthionis]
MSLPLKLKKIIIRDILANDLLFEILFDSIYERDWGFFRISHLYENFLAKSKRVRVGDIYFLAFENQELLDNIERLKKLGDLKSIKPLFDDFKEVYFLMKTILKSKSNKYLPIQKKLKELDLKDYIYNEKTFNKLLELSFVYLKNKAKKFKRDVDNDYMRYFRELIVDFEALINSEAKTIKIIDSKIIFEEFMQVAMSKRMLLTDDYIFLAWFLHNKLGDACNKEIAELAKAYVDQFSFLDNQEDEKIDEITIIN